MATHQKLDSYIRAYRYVCQDARDQPKEETARLISEME